MHALLAVLASLSPIVGGKPVESGAWPDVVAVLADGAACSGTLIAPDVVLTAGHCIATDPKVIVADSVDIAKPGGEVIAVAHAYAYPNWTRSYDVGVLLLARPAHVAPRAIATGCSLHDGELLEAVGFGLTSPAGENTVLHEAWLPVDDATCEARACRVPGEEVIAGGHGADACFGDSGGPAFVPTASGPALAGVTSRAIGNPCEDGAVFVRAEAVVDWIEEVTGRSLGRAPCEDTPEPGGCCAGGDLSCLGALAIVLAIWLARRRTE